MTREQLREHLLRLEVAGKSLAVHPELSGLGLREEDAAWVANALVEAVGPTGTILMPTFTYEQTVDRAISTPNVQTPRTVVPFHPELPTSEPVAEVFRRLPGALRSHHPTHSFAALGPMAREFLSTHRDNNPLGPLKKLNVHRGWLLLLGTSLERVVALHLALEGVGIRNEEKRVALRVNAAGYRERVVVELYPGCGRAFGKLEPLLDASVVRTVSLPTGAIRLLPIRYLLQLATRVLQVDRLALFCEQSDCQTCVPARRRWMSVAARTLG